LSDTLQLKKAVPIGSDIPLQSCFGKREELKPFPLLKIKKGGKTPPKPAFLLQKRRKS
jgi:hypothetical protein